MERLQSLPQDILAQLISVQNDKSIIPGQGFHNIRDTSHASSITSSSSSSSSSSSTFTPPAAALQKGRNSKSSSQLERRKLKPGERVSIALVEGSFRRIAGMTEAADASGSFVIRTVGLRREKGKTSLGFYVRRGDGWSRSDGVFVSRVVLGSIVETNGLLSVGDEIIKVNNVDVTRMPLEDVTVIMKYMSKLVLTVKVLTSVSLSKTWSTRRHPSESNSHQKSAVRGALPRPPNENSQYRNAHSSTGVEMATVLSAQVHPHRRGSDEEASHSVELVKSGSAETTTAKPTTVACSPSITLSKLSTESKDSGSCSEQVEFTELMLPSHSSAESVEGSVAVQQYSGMLTMTLHSIFTTNGPTTENSSLVCTVSLDSGPYFQVEVSVKEDEEGEKEVFIGNVYKMGMAHSSTVTFSVVGTAGEDTSQTICLSQLLESGAEDKNEVRHLLLKMNRVTPMKLSVRHQPISVAIPRLRRRPNEEQSISYRDYVALNPTGTGLPQVLERCIETIEEQGLETPGLYQRTATESEKREAFSTCQSENHRNTALHISVHAFAGVLLDFFRNLPEPFFTSDICSTLMEAVGVSNAAQVIGSFIECLPEEVGVALDVLVRHLRRVCEHSSLNKSTPEKLGRVFGPLLLTPAYSDGESNSTEIQDSVDFDAQAKVIELIISLT